MHTASRHARWSVRAAIALMLACIGWSLAPVFIRLCSADFDPITQSFVRYLSGSAMLATICLLRWRKEFLLLLRHPRPVLGISALNTLMQYVWTAGCYGTPATTAQLIAKLNIVFVIVLAYLLYREERAVIRDARYLAGTAVSLVGLVFVLMKDAHALIPVLDASTLLLISMAVLWAVYAVWGKHIAWKIHPVPMFGVMGLLTMLGLGILSLLFGEPSRVTTVPGRIWAIAFVSGFISIGVAHPAFHYAQRELGSALCTAVNLVNPLFTFLFSLVLLPAEHMLPRQWIGAAALIAGMLFVLRASQRHQTKDLPVEAAE